MKKYDVAVIGGGFAGAAAALAASREGASVLLVEKSNALGGAPINCLVNPFMPHSTKIDGVRTPLSQGLFTEICKRLKSQGAMRYATLHEEGLKYVLNQMMEEYGVDLLYHAYINKAKKSGSKITSVSVATRGGEMEIEADYFIDATGDAQLSYLAGCPTILGRPGDNLCQPMTLCFRLGNVDVKKFEASNRRMQAAYKKSLAKGKFMNPREDILFFKTPIHNVLHFNTTRVVKKNPTNPLDVTETEILARKQVYEIYDFMKKNADGLEDSFLMMTAAEIGVRESRMIVGEYVLTEVDCRAFTKFDDSVVACNYDIDIHNPEGSGTSHYYFPEGEYYTIPYRSLIPKDMDNLLVAGRCISSDHGAQASYRIMPTVCSIGEAAGCAIGMAVKGKCSTRALNVSELQSILKKHGAFIGI